MTKSITMPNANLILVTGGTEADPITMTDIHDADVAGGWGVVFNFGNTFGITENISFGDENTGCYIKSLNENIQIGTADDRRQGNRT